MDLNYLFHREQVERMRADEATCPKAREAHLEMAIGYGVQIAVAKEVRLETARARNWTP